MPKLRTKIQNSKMFGLAAKCNLTHDDLRDYAADVSGGRTDHTSELYESEMQTIIDRLEAVAAPKQQWSPRTIQYRRQKAGVKRIVSPKQLKLLNDLWFAKATRTQSGLEAFCLRVIKSAAPRTTAEANDVIEGVKAMNEREKANPKPKTQNPKSKEAA